MHSRIAMFLYGLLTGFGLYSVCGIYDTNEMYNKYLEAEAELHIYNWTTDCRIDDVIFRPSYVSKSLAAVNGTFLVSYQRPARENGERQMFEERSVPVPSQPNMVSV